jgi:hypothetical protein
MSNNMSNNMDFKPVVIRGKNPIKPRNISLVNVQKKNDLHHNNNMNAESLSRKIDEGIVTAPQKVPSNVSALFRDTRNAIKDADGKSQTQDVFAKQCGVQRVNAKFIQQLESGQLLLNHDNKIILRNLQRKLKIPHFDLP